MSGKKVLGLILLLLGASALLGLLGIHVGGIISLVVGALLLAYGWKNWQEDRKGWGACLIVLGLFFLLGSVPTLISLAIGVALVYAGYRLFTNNGDPTSFHSDDPLTTPPVKPVDDPFDEEWEKVMKSVK